MRITTRRILLSATCLLAMASAPTLRAADDPTAKPDHELTLQTSGKWTQSLIVADAASAAKLKAHPVLKVDISVSPETEDKWFMAKLAIQADGFERTESPKWLLDRAPGKNGLDNVTLTWDTTDVVAKMPDHPNWFKIELVNQGGQPRTIYVDNVRYADATGGAAVTEKLKPLAPPPPPAPTLATPYPDKEADFPGKGPARKFPYMQGERDAFFKARERDNGAIVFVGDSLTGGWRTLAKDIPSLKVANRGVGGDTSRNVVFRFKEDVLVLNPPAVVIEIGNNDLTAMGKPADTLSNVADLLAQADAAHPGLPVVLCSIPPSANPKAPVKAQDRATINDGLRKLAADRKNTRFVDLYAAMANDDGSPKPEYFAEDKLHLSPAGHKKWAELVTPVLEAWKAK